MDDLNFKFRAYSDGDKIVVHVTINGAEAVFRYSNEESIGILAANMEKIIEYAIEDYTLNKMFKKQIETELDEWLKDG